MAGIIRVVLTIVVLLVAVGLYFAGILVTTPEAVITWTTETETNTAGFHVYRSETQEGDFDQRVTTELIRSKSPDGFTGAEYEFRDPSVEQGKTYFYQLEELETSGNFNRLPDTVRYDATPAPDGTIALVLFAVVLLIWLVPTPKRPETIVSSEIA
jgi:hypothetical protein